MNRIRNNKGFTVIELLIALFITGIIAAAGFQFYIQMHNSALTQEEISDMQQSSRASLEEISESLRMAGFKVDSAHPAYLINGESLFVFASITQPVDTILYYVESIPDTSLVLESSLSDVGLKPRRLMVKYNHGTPQVFADNIHSLRFRAINPTTVEVSLVVQPMKADVAWTENEGYRTYSAVERVKLRNLDI